MIFFILYVLLCTAVAYYAEQNGRSGLLFGLISIFTSPVVGIICLLVVGPDVTPIIAAKMQYANATVRCRHCTEIVRVGARVCPHCTRDLFDQVPSGQTLRRAKGFYYQDNGTEEGPFTAEDMITFREVGTIDDQTPVRKDDAGGWKPFASFPDFTARA